MMTPVVASHWNLLKYSVGPVVGAPDVGLLVGVELVGKPVGDVVGAKVAGQALHLLGQVVFSVAEARQSATSMNEQNPRSRTPWQ